MTPQKAAAYIRATFPIFRAHPESFAIGEQQYWLPGGKFNVIGGACALIIGPGKPKARWSYDSLPLRRALMNVCMGHRSLWENLQSASIHATDVEDMITRVEAVLKEAGL